jgi:hypothetical protein
MSHLECAITDGHAKLTGEGKQQKVIHVAVNHTDRYANTVENRWLIIMKPESKGSV